MARLKVLISGGGIAGNALSFWLSKLGHDVTVIERFPSLRATGLQIDLRGHGIQVLRHMGLEQAFRSKAAPEQGVQLVDSSGRRRAFFPANRSGKGLQSFTTDFEIMRGDFCRLIYEAGNQRAKYVFDTTIESFHQSDSGVEVRFADGRKDHFDLLVGADGQGSRTRKLLQGPEADGFLPLGGSHIGYFTIPRPVKEGEEYIATMYLSTGRRFIMTRRHNPHEMQVYLACSPDSEDLQNARGDVKAQKKILTQIFQGAGWQTEEILKALDGSDDFYLETLGLVKMDSWSQGRVVLVGDAAYCPSANTGMGTTSAMVGAYVLAGEIGRHCGASDEESTNSGKGLATALEAYDLRFRPFMDQVQKGISKDTYNGLPSSAFGVAVWNWAIGLASLLRLNVFGQYILKENVKGWDLPVYDEMLRD